MALRKGLERVLGPFRSDVGQFVYEDGFPLRSQRPVWLIYTKKDKIEMFVDKDGVPLYTTNPKDITPYSSYKLANPEFRRELYLKPFNPVVNTIMQKDGSFYRGFATYLLDQDKCIFEIKNESVNTMTSFYSKTSLLWTIFGQREDVRMKNINALELANNELPGIRDFLNPLEFYLEEQTDQDRVQNILQRLLHNPHTYGHQSDASNVGSAIGLSGTHTMPDGSVMPGATHQQYLNSLRRNDEITTSSGTSIPTQNLRRNSGY